MHSQSSTGFSLGSLFLEGAFGYAGAAIFTTINPILGAAFGATSSVVTTVAREILDKNVTSLPLLVRSGLSHAAGIFIGGAVVGLLAGTTLTASAALGLALSIIAAKIIVIAAAAVLCPTLAGI